MTERKKVERYWVPVYADIVYDNYHNVYKIIFDAWKEGEDDDIDEPVRRLVILLSDEEDKIIEMFDELTNKLIELKKERGRW